MSETITAADMTEAEKAAWEVAVSRGLNISRADLRALLSAAVTQHKRRDEDDEAQRIAEIFTEARREADEQ